MTVKEIAAKIINVTKQAAMVEPQNVDVSFLDLKGKRKKTVFTTIVIALDRNESIRWEMECNPWFEKYLAIKATIKDTNNGFALGHIKLNAQNRENVVNNSSTLYIIEHSNAIHCRKP
mmetsp:Transcript_10458/g.15388  ORF Transcript_10458/g.15388 Transcript_10458/m.15388 type:complete len:118 (+) Transcript_10458:2396-2749(+)